MRSCVPQISTDCIIVFQMLMNVRQETEDAINYAKISLAAERVFVPLGSHSIAMMQHAMVILYIKRIQFIFVF